MDCAAAAGINVDAAMEESAAYQNYSLLGPPDEITKGRNYTLNAQYRGISLISVTSLFDDGTLASSYAGVGFGARPGASLSAVTSSSWGKPYGLGIRLSGNYGGGRYGVTSSTFITFTGVNISEGPSVGNVNTRGNASIGWRSRAQ